MDTNNKSANEPYIDGQAQSNQIVHIGFGAFHRAHQAIYTQLLANMVRARGDHFNWCIYAVNLRSGANLIEDLSKQSYEYHIIETQEIEESINLAHHEESKTSHHHTEIHKINVVKTGLHPNLNSVEEIIELLCAETTKIVSLTITEKGYYLDHISHRLDLSHPDIQTDLNNPTSPITAIGYIVAALNRRKILGLPGFTVLSCDNLSENGKNTKIAVSDFAACIDVDLAEWIRSNVTFPNTMVDRIVPAATPETFATISSILGKPDPCGLITEPFKQWVIEDNFILGRPNWNEVGAEFVHDVIPYENMKLSMLNGTHSFLAYLGYLAGYEFIYQTMEDADFKMAAKLMMLEDQASSLDIPSNSNAKDYAEMLITRFSNRQIKHKTWQIAMDGSQKIPQRLLPSLEFHVKNCSNFKWIALGIAGWMRYISGIDENNSPIDVRDPLTKEFSDLYALHGLNQNYVQAILAMSQIFPVEMSQNLTIQKQILSAFELLTELGSRKTISLFVKG